MSSINGKSEFYFPMIIAITALVLSLISGVVNYRQNNLANLESSLRDTRDQLQLAKSDIADIKMKTVQKLVDAEMAYKTQERLEDEKNELRLDLADAHDRISELETQIKSLDRSLEKKKILAKGRKIKVKAVKEVTKKSTEKATVAKNKMSKIDTNAGSASQAVTAAEMAKPETADVDIYTVDIEETMRQNIADGLSNKGFVAKFPEKRKSMSMANITTVFYYNDSYKKVALQLVKDLSDMSSSKVILRKGASPFKKNKIVVHIIGN